jgi:hypothetical protein
MASGPQIAANASAGKRGNLSEQIQWANNLRQIAALLQARKSLDGRLL